MATRLEQFAENVLHCAKTQCPFHQTRPGGYPKFSYGNPISKVIAVFQNPGQPTYQEQQKTIDTVTVKEMRRWANGGVTNWLSKHIDLSALEYDGRPFLDLYYMTQAYRCPDPPNKTSAKQNKARRDCLDYLRQEINIIKPKVILTFGGEALESVRSILSPSSKVAGLTTLFLEEKVIEWDGVRVFPLVHPNGYKYFGITKVQYTQIVHRYVSQIKKQR